MLNWNKTISQLQAAAQAHEKLAALFERFANEAVPQPDNPSVNLKGIKCEKHLEKGFFTLTFAARTVAFIFSSHIDAKSYMEGKVTCYVKNNLHESEHKSIGAFTFSTSGKTDQLDADNNEICMDSDIGALAISLHFLNQSLHLS